MAEPPRMLPVLVDTQRTHGVTLYKINTHLQPRASKNGNPNKAGGRHQGQYLDCDIAWKRYRKLVEG